MNTTAPFSSAPTANKAALFEALIEEASSIGDYNFRSYFVRRAIEDQGRAESISIEELQERLV